MNKLLTVKNLKKNYLNKKNIVKAIDDVSFDIYEREFFCIVGPSGCGKSTILSIIGKLDNKSCGLVNYHGKDIKVGYMFQEDTLMPWLNVYENCILGLKIRNELTSSNIKYVKDLLKKYDLISFEKSYPKELSGGMRQRVALIRTLAIKPDILLLDEPFSALDYQTRIEVSDDVYRIIKEEMKTAIIVTHDIAEAVSISDRVMVLTKRPAKVKNIYEIKLDNKSIPSKARESKNFNYYYDLIWKDLISYER